MNIKTQSQLLSDCFYQISNQILHQKKKAKAQLPTFRASQLPICPRELVLSNMFYSNTNGTYPNSMANKFSDYFLEEGTLIHKLIQRYMGLTGKLYGLWGCQNPKCKHSAEKLAKQYEETHIPPVKPRLHSGFCCGLPMDYIEFLIADKSIDFSGHIDGIYHIGYGIYAIIDFKTSILVKKCMDLLKTEGKEAAEDYWQENYKMILQYSHQLNSYFSYLSDPKKRKKLKIPKISELYLVYVPRDFYFLEPNNWKWVEIDPDPSIFKKDIKLYQSGKKILKTKSVKEYNKLPKVKSKCTGDYGNCEFYDICHSKDIDLDDNFRKWKKNDQGVKKV